MMKFKLGVMLGFLAGWAVGSGKAAQMMKQLRSSPSTEVPGSVAARVPKPAVERPYPPSAVSA
jgi:hypothetical protein